MNAIFKYICRQICEQTISYEEAYDLMKELFCGEGAQKNIPQICPYHPNPYSPGFPPYDPYLTDYPPYKPLVWYTTDTVSSTGPTPRSELKTPEE